MNKIRIFVDKDETANDILNTIKRLYPDMKKYHPFVEIEITLFKGCDPSLTIEITNAIMNSKILEFRDRFFFSSM